MNFKSILPAGMAWLSFTLFLTGCADRFDEARHMQERTVTATIEDARSETRSCIDGATLRSNFVGMLWEPHDVIGIYGNDDTNVPFTNNATANSPKTSFSGNSKGVLKYAYFPYSAANDNKPASALSGTLPKERTISANHHIEADYKYGEIASGAADTDINFTHLLSLARIVLDGTESDMVQESVKSVEFSAKRDDVPLTMSGDFTFSAVDGSLTIPQDGNTTTKAVWTDPVQLGTESVCFMSMFPNLKNGDVLTIAVMTDKRLVSFHVTIGIDFQPGNFYTFPLRLSAYKDKTEYGWIEQPVTPEEDVIRGSFTAASYNVDGLKDINYVLGSINSDGPGAEGTAIMGKRVNDDYKWDFFGVSENFHYNNELTEALVNYNAGTWRGDVLSTSGNKNTDGLGFFWKKKGVSVSGESWTAFNQSAGGLTEGANTLISKGYRYYLVTLADGTEIDVYITHMNTYGEGARKEAQHAQLTQIADAILANNNGRPIIFMGDTNLRYTRHEIYERLIKRINDTDGWCINDPWIDYYWNGDYLGVSNHGKSIMAIPPNKDTNADTDDFGPTGNGYGYQKGEIVDKVFYINRTSNKTQIKANGYLADESFGNMDGKAFGDHYPVVIEFSYVRTK